MYAYNNIIVIIIIIHNTFKFQLHHNMQIILFNIRNKTSRILLLYVSNTYIE